MQLADYMMLLKCLYGGVGLGVLALSVAICACADAHGSTGLEHPGPSPMDVAEAAVQQMTSDEPATGESTPYAMPFPLGIISLSFRLS